MKRGVKMIWARGDSLWEAQKEDKGVMSSVQRNERLICLEHGVRGRGL